jgi:hypothetical protein
MAKIRVSKLTYDKHVMSEAKKIHRKRMYLGEAGITVDMVKDEAETIIAKRYEIIK